MLTQHIKIESKKKIEKTTTTNCTVRSSSIGDTLKNTGLVIYYICTVGGFKTFDISFSLEGIVIQHFIISYIVSASVCPAHSAG